MKQLAQTKDEPVEGGRSTVEEVTRPAVSIEEALLACMPSFAVHATNAAGVEHATTQANCGFEKVRKENHDVVVPRTSLVRSTLPLQDAVLACMPGAYQIPGPSNTTATPGVDYVDALLHEIAEGEERPCISAANTLSIEHEDQQQQSTQTNIVSAYRVAEAEPAIIAIPFKDNKYHRFLIYGVLVTAVIGLIVGLSVILTGSHEQTKNNTEDHLVSSVVVTADQGSSFFKAKRYSRIENGQEIATTIGSAVLNFCEVVPCNQGDCVFSHQYEPGCCLGDDCSPSDICGAMCPRGVCHPTIEACIDSSCFECDRGRNGEILYRARDMSFNMNCLRTGVAIGFNDRDDDVERIYKWAIICGFNLEGGSEWQNFSPGEYLCIAVRSGNGITKTMSIPVACQHIQLMECGCAPDDVHTLGLPLPSPEKPCKTKEDCTYLCGDAGEEEARSLCESFPGIEWWDGENPLFQSLFADPTETIFANLTIEIDIYA